MTVTVARVGEVEAEWVALSVAPVALGQVDWEAPGLPVPLTLPPPPLPSEGLCSALGVLVKLAESEA